MNPQKSKKPLLQDRPDLELSNNQNPTKTTSFSPFFKQLFVVIGIMLHKMGCGAALGYTAILLPSLMVTDSDIPLTEDMASWTTSVFPFGVLMASLISPFVMKRFGRKASQQISALAILIGWIAIANANNTTNLIVGRILHGFANGFQLVVLTVTISESTCPEYRGFFLGTVSLSISLGKFLSHVIGTFYHWRTTAYMCTSVSIVSMVVVAQSPETPNWLASQERYEKAKKSFLWLRGSEKESLDEMEIFIQHKINTHNEIKKVDNLFYAIKRRRKELLIPFGKVMLVWIAYNACTTELMAVYTINILNEILDEKKDAYFIMNVMDIARILSSLFGMFLIKRFNRRTVMFASGWSTVASLLLFSTYVYFTSIKAIPCSSIIINILLNISIFCMTVGVLPMAFVYSGELFPLSDKELGGFLTALCTCSCMFLIVKTAFVFFANLSIYGSFALYALVLSIDLVILYFVLPETKDRTLVQIETKDGV